ncbi:MAG: polymer-forming cytoskeletal protein [Bryobacteraceae bacterium]|jgi:cytoskeletal protein CcmA (bactofilin family)
MWNKRRDEEEPKSYSPPVMPAPQAPAQTQFKKEATPVSGMTVGRMEQDIKMGGTATIGKAVKMVGQIHSKEDLFVDGDVEGTVEAPEHKLIIGQNGTLHATIKAREVVVLGTIQGNVEAADRIEIRKEARLVGDLRTARIIIEDGAYFKGSIDIVKPEPVKAAPKPPVQATAPVAAPPAPVAAAADTKR